MRQLRARALHLLIRLCILTQQRLVVRKQVKVRQVRFLIKKLLRIVLPVDVNELHPELPQDRRRHGASVYAAGAFAALGNFALDLQFVRIIRHLILPRTTQAPARR